MPRSLQNIISDLVSTQDKAPESFFGGIVSDIEGFFWKGILRLLGKADTKKGKFENSSDNQNLLIGLGKEFKDIHKKSKLNKSVDSFTREFDIIESLNKEFYRETLQAGEMKDLTQLYRDTRIFKTKQIDDISQALLNPKVFETNITKELTDIIFDGIVLGGDVADIESRLREKVISDDKGNSKILRYSRQISMDAIGQFNGALTQKAVEQFNLDGWGIVGPTLETSRANCVDMHCIESHAKYTGQFNKFKLKGTKGFRVADIEAIITQMKKEPNEGLNKDIQFSNFFILRGGYGCDDQYIAFRLLEGDDIPENEELQEILKD